MLPASHEATELGLPHARRYILKSYYITHFPLFSYSADKC